MMTMNKSGIYIHIPFCLRKCPYCDFYSLSLNESCAEDYVNALVSHIGSYKGKSISVDSVYFGGGTPTSLPAKLLVRVLDAVNDAFCVDDDCEITVEANPCTVDYEYLHELRNAGFNRISFGVQSACDTELEALGRLHSFDEAKNAVLTARSTGFENISCDLMIGVIGQTQDSLCKSIDELVKLPINHISAYMLKIEEGTPYDCDAFRKALFDDDVQADMYLLAVAELERKGFVQYEISNFCKGGKRSRHNMKYWKLDDYIGFGPSAHSFFGGKRFFYSRDLEGYIKDPLSTLEIEDENPDKLIEYTMLSLRLCDGLDVGHFKKLGGDVSRLEKLASDLCFSKLATYNEGILRLTPNGFLVSNSVISRVLNI